MDLYFINNWSMDAAEVLRAIFTCGDDGSTDRCYPPMAIFSGAQMGKLVDSHLG